MKIASVLEDINIEKRIAITPDIAKKYITNGFEILIEKGLGSHLGFSDDDFLKEGCKLEKKENIFSRSDIILQLNLPEESNLEYFKENNILIGNFNSNQNFEKISKFKIKKEKDKIIFLVESKSFLQKQVRSMVGCLKYVGESKWKPEKIREILKLKKRSYCAPPAPPEGLYLKKVFY